MLNGDIISYNLFTSDL